MTMYGEIKKLVSKFIDNPLKVVAVAYLLYTILKPHTKTEENYREKLEILYDNK